jgi:hypothetical protein
MPQPPMSRSVVAPMAETTTTTHAGRRPGYLLAFAALCVALVTAMAIPSAGARRAIVLGKTKHNENPACPQDTNQHPCSAIGSVTGFMTKADGRKHPFNIFKDGKIVAWAIHVSNPNKTQRNFFGTLFESEAFGQHPSARISVIKNKSHRKYKLVKQSKALDLQGVLGRKQIFTLNKPLRVHPGQVIALTLPTWAPNFAVNLSPSDNQWRASRKKGRCNTDRDHIRNVKASRPQQNVGSLRPYECRYSGARLLYWAYFVPSKKK